MHEVFVDQTQLDWFEGQLAGSDGRPVIVFTHAPPLGSGLKVVEVGLVVYSVIKLISALALERLQVIEVNQSANWTCAQKSHSVQDTENTQQLKMSLSGLLCKSH